MNKIVMCLMMMAVAIAICEAGVSASDLAPETFELQGSTPLSLPPTTVEFMNSSHIYRTIRLCNESDMISGSLHGINSESEIYLLPLHPSRKIEDIKIVLNNSVKQLRVMPDRNGTAYFILGIVSAGSYILAAKESNNSSLLATMPLLVTKPLNISSLEKFSAGDNFEVKMRANDAGNHIMGAIIMPVDDYYQINITVSDNLTIQRGDLLANIKSLNMESLLELLLVVPDTGTLAYDQPSGNESTLFLITDSSWQARKYVLICADYCQKNISIAQRFIEMV